MENEVSVRNFANADHRGLNQENIHAEFSPEFNRKTCSELDKIIKDAWQEAVEKNSHLFDGSKFRLAAADFQSNKLCLKLGLTSYAEFIGTNCMSCQQIDQWQAKGQHQFGQSSAFFANPLGVGALVRTADQRFVFMRRSAICGEAQGLIDRPGGHPEPENLKLSSESQSVPVNVTSEVLVREIFESAMTEVRDEIGVPLEALSNVQLMGIVYNKTKAGRPSAEFYMTMK